MSHRDNYVGKRVTLAGLTLKGKNRIHRGGNTFDVVTYSDGYGYFLRSEKVGQRECFWAWLPNDPHVRVTRVRAAARGVRDDGR